MDDFMSLFSVPALFSDLLTVLSIVASSSHFQMKWMLFFFFYLLGFYSILHKALKYFYNPKHDACIAIAGK